LVPLRNQSEIVRNVRAQLDKFIDANSIDLETEEEKKQNE
jgi:hypothetical protein